MLCLEVALYRSIESARMLKIEGGVLNDKIDPMGRGLLFSCLGRGRAAKARQDKRGERGSERREAVRIDSSEGSEIKVGRFSHRGGDLLLSLV